MIVSCLNKILGDMGVNYSVCYTDLTLEAIGRLEANEEAAEEAQRLARIDLREK